MAILDLHPAAKALTDVLDTAGVFLITDGHGITAQRLAAAWKDYQEELDRRLYESAQTAIRWEKAARAVGCTEATPDA